MIVCPGIDEAIIGTHVNEHLVTVPVYDQNKVIEMFITQNETQERAVGWMNDVIGSWDEHIRPVFINYDPRISTSVKAQRSRVN